MSVFVVDASVGMKWFVPEPWDVEAHRLFNDHSLHAPALFVVEMASILRKKIQQGGITRTKADSILVQLPTLAVQIHQGPPLVPVAFEVALQTGTTIYDCLYLALALQLRGQMVTADDAFVAKLTATTWAASVLRVQDVP